jgi:hypothetical protein
VINRSVQPAGPPAMYKTYQLLQPTATHFRAATCAEVGCPRQRSGWRSVMDVATTDGRNLANWVRLKSGRSFTVEQTGTVVTFTFAAGQRCFGKHQLPVGRPPLLRIVGGDWRGNPRQLRTQELRPQAWVDNFGEHQLTLSEAHKRG